MPAPLPPNVDALGTSAHFVAYPGAVADTNLVTEGLGPCRRIRVTTAGNLVVKRASDNTNITLAFAAGETQEVSANALVAASSTAQGVQVYW